MSCFGSHPIDRWMESKLDEYLAQGEAEEQAFEEAERKYGNCIYQEGDLYIFEDGAYGLPVMEEDADEDGRYWSLCGLKDCQVYKTKDGGYIVKATQLVPSKRKSPKKYRGYLKEVVSFFMRIPPQ